MDKPLINYPCEWSYTIIGTDRAVMEKEISSRLDSLEYSLTPSKQSPKGKYLSLKLSTTVSTEAQRIGLYEILNDVSTVKIVL